MLVYARRYIHGWLMFARTIYLMRTKRRGAGAAKWIYCFRCAISYRWMVDGQMRGGKFPRWIRRGRQIVDEQVWE